MAGLEIVIHFATNSSFAQTPNYVGSDAPQIKSAHLLRSKIVFGCSRLVNDTKTAYDISRICRAMSIL
jgi:hypothetical protein